MLSALAHGLAIVFFASLVIAASRWIYLRSRVLGVIVGLAVTLRIVSGLALFAISYYRVPIAESLQFPGGFWQPTLDAVGYFQLAAEAVTRGALYPLDHSVPSPVYVNTLASWMTLVGVSPVSGMFLNLCLYVAVAAAIVWAFSPVNDWRRDLPAIVGVSAYCDSGRCFTVWPRVVSTR